MASFFGIKKRRKFIIKRYLKVYFETFVNKKQNNKVKLLSMSKFAYNNIENTIIGHTFFNLNYKYNICVFFDDKIYLSSKYYLVDKLARELKKSTIVY